MVLNVTYGPQDYREALRAAGIGVGFTELYGWVVVINLAIVSLQFMPPAPPPGTPATLGRTVLTLLPLLIFPALVLVIFVSYMRALRRLKKPGPRKQWFGISGWVAAMIALVAVGVLTANESDPKKRHDAIAGAIPLLLILGLFTVMAAWFGRANIRRMWGAVEELHRPRAIQIDDTGIAISDGVIHYQATWPAIVQWRETDNLFVVYTSKLVFMMLPKRGLSDDPAGVDTLRQILQYNIHAPTGAFPLQPKEPVGATPAS